MGWLLTGLGVYFSAERGEGDSDANFNPRVLWPGPEVLNPLSKNGAAETGTVSGWDGLARLELLAQGPGQGSSLQGMYSVCRYEGTPGPRNSPTRKHAPCHLY